MPENEELVTAAKDAIGNDQPDQDWKVTPTEHAALLVRAKVLLGAIESKIA